MTHASDYARRVGVKPRWRGRGISILNGVVGDYLDRRVNGLAIAMAFVQDGRPLAVTAQGLRAAQPALSRKLVILVHGWCCDETVWRFPHEAATYATKLQVDAGYTPFSVRYNTGLPVGQSGQDLARLLRALIAAYPLPIDEIVLIGHSMGGLVIRAACHVGSETGDRWVDAVNRIFYIATPLDGADLARFAHGATLALSVLPNPIARLVGNVLDVRSRGVKDLRTGGSVASDGESGSTALAGLPWLASATHTLLVGTLTGNPHNLVSKTLGDGLVRVPAARDGRLKAPADVTVFPGLHHLQLAHDAAVYAAIRRRCTTKG